MLDSIDMADTEPATTVMEGAPVAVDTLPQAETPSLGPADQHIWPTEHFDFDTWSFVGSSGDAYPLPFLDFSYVPVDYEDSSQPPSKRRRGKSYTVSHSLVQSMPRIEFLLRTLA